MTDLSQANLDCIELLEQVLRDAKAGNVSTVAIVACGPHDFGANIAGPNAQGAYMGLGVLRAKIEAAVTQPVIDMRPTILKPSSNGSVMRPRPVPKR